jgi:hypothetical protein
MGLRWDRSHEGTTPALLGYDGQYLVAQVARYDMVAGQGPGWVGYVRGIRVTGRCTTADVAQRAVEARRPRSS